MNCDTTFCDCTPREGCTVKGWILHKEVRSKQRFHVTKLIVMKLQEWQTVG